MFHIHIWPMKQFEITFEGRSKRRHHHYGGWGGHCTEWIWGTNRQKNICKSLTPPSEFLKCFFPRILTFGSFSSPLEAKQTGQGLRGGILAEEEEEEMTTAGKIIIRVLIVMISIWQQPAGWGWRCWRTGRELSCSSSPPPSHSSESFASAQLSFLLPPHLLLSFHQLPHLPPPFSLPSPPCLSLPLNQPSPIVRASSWTWTWS